MQGAKTNTAEKRYNELKYIRAPYLDTAEKCSNITLPGVIQSTERRSRTKECLPAPYQSLGARGVSNLSSKILLATIPPNEPFFQIKPSQKTLIETREEVEETYGPEEAEEKYEEFLAETDAALIGHSKEILRGIEATGDRTKIEQILRHLIIAGNALGYLTEKGFQFFSLENYVVDRGPDDALIDIVVRETLSLHAAPKEILDLIGHVPPPETEYPTGGTNPGSDYGPGSDEVDVYTWVYRTERGWSQHQEIEGQVIPGSEKEYKSRKLPWLPVRFHVYPGEVYGRGHVETIWGDLNAYEMLTKLSLEATAAAAQVRYLRKPGAALDKAEFEKSDNLDVLDGADGDVAVLRLEKGQDLALVQNHMDRLERSLGQAFLLHAATQRDAERVTAEEIRLTAEQLDTQLGGMYSIISEEFQKPYLEIKRGLLERSGRISPLDDELVDVTITTGIEALGRATEREKFFQFLQTAQTIEGAAVLLNPLAIIERLGEHLGVHTRGLVKTPEQTQQEQEASMMQAGAQAAAPEAAKAAVQQMATTGEEVE